MQKRRSLDVSDSVTPALLRRETFQLALLAVLSATAFLFAPGWLRIVAGAGAAVVALACMVAVVVAWRNLRRTAALVVYTPASAVFTALALLNIWR